MSSILNSHQTVLIEKDVCKLQHLETTASWCTDVSVELHKLAEFVLVFTLSTSLIISSFSAIVYHLGIAFSLLIIHL